MKFSHFFLTISSCALLFSSQSWAGEYIASAPDLPKQSLLLDPIDARGWELELGLYGWGPGLSAEIGNASLTGHTEVKWGDLGDLLDEIDFASQGRVGVRKGKFGVIADWFYLRISDEKTTADPIFQTISFKTETVILDAAVTYRLLEGERGYLDAMAGVRYWYLGETVGINLDTPGIERFSRNASQRVVGEVTDSVSAAVADAVQKARPIVEDQIRNGIDDRTGRVVGPDDLNVALAGGLSTTNVGREATSGRGFAPGSFERERGDLISAIIAERKADAINNASGTISSVKKSAQKKLQKKVASAQRKLERAISKKLKSIPTKAHVSKEWADPYVGLIGKYALTEKLYVVGRGDIGGFGVSSDLTWQAVGAVGTQLSENIAMELGYKHLSVDYDRGFVFDADLSGFFAGVSITLK
ncbi:MAG: hypothetical protein ACI8XO_001706 [Verrucomicrobiales bacterium]|jgi:hypothetical protein